MRNLPASICEVPDSATQTGGGIILLGVLIFNFP